MKLGLSDIPKTGFLATRPICINAQLLSTVGIWRAQREMNSLWRTA